MDSPKAIITTPERISINLSGEHEIHENQAENGISELSDTENYFFESNRLEMNPRIILMERELIDTEKQIKLIMNTIAEEEQKVNAPQMQKTQSQKKEAQQLMNYTSAALQAEQDDIEKLTEDSKNVKKQKQALLEQINILGHEIEKNKEKIYDLNEEDARTLAEKITTAELEKTDRDREYQMKCGEIEELQRKIEKHEKQAKSYKQFLENMSNFIKNDNNIAKKSHLEEMMEALNKHYEKVKQCSLLELRKKNPDPEITMKDLIRISNEELSKLEKIPSELKYEKSDVLYDAFSRIWEMIMDNITARKELNLHTETLNEHLSKKLQQDPDTFENIDILPLDQLKTWDLEKPIADTRILLEIPQRSPTPSILSLKNEMKSTPTPN